jgi:integrase
MPSIKLVLASYKNKKGEQPLQVRYIHGTANYPFSLGISLLSKQVNLEKMEVKPSHPEAERINKQIRTIKSKLESILASVPSGFEPSIQYVLKKYKEMEEAQKRESLVSEWHQEYSQFYADIKQQELTKVQQELNHIKASKFYEAPNNCQLNELLNSFDEFFRKLNAKPQSKRNYIPFRNIFFQDFPQSAIFKKHQKQLGIEMSWNGMNVDMYNSFQDYCYSVRKYSDGNFGKMVKMWKTWLKSAEIEQKKPVNPEYKSKNFKRLRVKPETFIILYEWEVKLIWQERENLSDREKKIADVLVFSWCSGLRIGEILQERLELETLSDGRVWLVGKTFKNNSEFMIPSWKHDFPYITTLLQEYNHNMKLCSDVEFNRVSKELLRKLYQKHNLHQQPERVYKKVAGKDVYVGDLFKWERFTSRSCRRSAIYHWFYSWGWDKEKIQALVGSQDLEVLDLYIRKTKKDKLKMFIGD